MDVQDPVRERRDELPAEEPHVARETDPLRPGPLDLLPHSSFMGRPRSRATARNDSRVQTQGAGMLDAHRGGDVAQDQHDARGQPPFPGSPIERLEVAPATGDQDGDGSRPARHADSISPT